MSNDAAQDQTTTGANDTADTGTSDFDSALIPQEADGAPLDQSANRATAKADPETDGTDTGRGDENTDPNAQPPA